MATMNCWLFLQEIIAVYSENRVDHTNTLCGENAALLSVKAAGTYTYHWPLSMLTEAWNKACFTYDSYWAEIAETLVRALSGETHCYAPWHSGTLMALGTMSR
jgi:hypothetical protein